MRVQVLKHLPRVFSPAEVQLLLDACTRLRDRLLLCLLHESGMRIGQALGLRQADIRSYDGGIDIVPRSKSNGALAKCRSPYVVHVSKQAMALYADYLVHEYGEAVSDFVFVNWWGGRVGSPMQYSTVIDLFRKLSKRTGLEATPHMCRPTHATDLLRADWMQLMCNCGLGTRRSRRPSTPMRICRVKTWVRCSSGTSRSMPDECLNRVRRYCSGSTDLSAGGVLGGRYVGHASLPHGKLLSECQAAPAPLRLQIARTQP